MAPAACIVFGGVAVWLFALCLSDPSATSRPVRAAAMMEAKHVVRPALG